MTWDQVCAEWDNGSTDVFTTTIDLGRRGRRIFKVRPLDDFFEYQTVWLGANEPLPADLGPWKLGDDPEYRRAAADGQFTGCDYVKI